MAPRGPRTRCAPNRQFAPIRPGNRAAGAADVAKTGDVDGPAIAPRRSSQPRKVRVTPSNRDCSASFSAAKVGPKSAYRSRTIDSARVRTLSGEPMVDGSASALGKQARGTVLLEATQQTKHLTPLQADQHTGVTDAQPTRLNPQ